MSELEFKLEDEVLMPLEIHEFLSLDDILKEDPTFVAFSNDELLVYIQQLVKSEHRAKAFCALHKSILNPTKANLVRYAQLHVDASRKVELPDAND
jgi:hypothetical protein